MLPLVAAGLVSGIIGGIGKIFGRGKANREMDKIRAQNMAFANKRLGLAETLLNARMPGSAYAQNNIFSNSANALARVNRNSTDASQALLLGGQVQGQTDESLGKLAEIEAADYQRRFGNLENENDRMQSTLNQDYELRSMKNENRQNSWGDISKLGFGLADFGLKGGFGKMSGNNMDGQMRSYLSSPVESTLPSTQIDYSSGGLMGRRTLNVII